MFTSLGHGASRCSSVWFLVFACSLILESKGKADDATNEFGRELFEREWIPNDVRSHGGDGLGPQFNESSCVGCHNQGGLGGAGSSAKNVQLVSVFRSDQGSRARSRQRTRSSSQTENPGRPEASAKSVVTEQNSRQQAAAAVDPFGEPTNVSNEGSVATQAQPDAITLAADIQRERDQLAAIHPAFRNTNTAVLHQFSTTPRYRAFRHKFGSTFFGQAGTMGNTGMPGMGRMSSIGGMTGIRVAPVGPHEGLAPAIPQALLETQAEVLVRAHNTHIGDFALIVGERNTSALFGSGQIDAIPESVLIAASKQKFEQFPDVSGRVAILKDGRLGRFGWKAQKASLRDFVLTACAVELGLQVPGETQAVPHGNPTYSPPGLDLNEQECSAMVAFITNLPAPRIRTIAHESARDYLKQGRAHFDSVGCGVCHTPHLGQVKNIYSDLLLHDMGPELSDSGSYGGFAPNSPEDDEARTLLPTLASRQQINPFLNETNAKGATRREWRTPPLWGVRDSAPYLHDGRANTLEQAIALHDGEGAASARKFFELPEPDRLQVTLFLRALVAP